MKLAELHEAAEDSLQIYKHDTQYTIKFKDKDSFLRLCLWEIKNGEGTGHVVKYWIKRCRDAGYDYPEFKAIEKSIGGTVTEMIYMKDGENGLRIPVGGTSRKPELQFVAFSDKRELIRAVLVMLQKELFHSVKDSIRACRDAGYDYPEFKAIEKSAGEIKEGNNDGVSIYNKDGSKDVVRFRDKEKFIKLALQELRTGNIHEVLYWLKMCQDAGYDYSEFKAIRKSASVHEAKGTYTIYGEDGPFMFADKDKFIKHLLRFLKSGERGDEDYGWIRSKALWWIKMARDDGYDYPEFKAIEKSLGK